MKNGCGRLSQNDFIPVILAQKRKSPYLAIEIGAAGDSSGSTGNKPKAGLTLSRNASRAMGERNALALKFKNGSDPGTQIPFRW